jgi:hypothetical protein
MNWYYWSENSEVGPLTERALRELEAAGVVCSETPVRRQDSGDWTNLAALSTSAPSVTHPPASIASGAASIRSRQKGGRKTMVAWIVGGSVVLVLVIAVIAVLAFRSFDKAMVSGLLKEADDIALLAEGEQDWERMVFLLRKAAEKGSHEAEYKLGACYAFGRGVPQDAREAARLYGLAAEGGIVEAQYNLAVCYGRGEGIERNEEKMLKWLKIAADQKLFSAQLFLGRLYRDGQAVPQDQRKGIELITASANQGAAEAQYELSLCYEIGNGAPQDMVQAYKWAIISIRSGITRGDEAEGDELLTKLRSQMTDAQISEGERLANGWKPQASQK